jgi:G3E family GTPase
VTCVVDGEHGLAILANHDIAQDQVAMADIRLVSKVDIAARASIDALQTQLATLNADAEIVEVANGDIDAAQLFGRSLFQPEARDATLSPAGTSVFLNRVVNEMKDDMLRIKGIAAFREKGGKPAVLHAVRNKFYPVTYH